MKLDKSPIITFGDLTAQGAARSGGDLGGAAPQRAKRIKINFEKIWKKGLTHAIWLAIGLVTGGAWVFYFNDAPTLADQIIHFDIPWSVGGWMLALTGSTYLMAGYAREQVCTYMCPYARFQSAMFDKDTLIIAYDEQRGEPRGKWKHSAEYLARTEGRASPELAVAALQGEDSNPSREQFVKQGHCIDCDSCVVVCPMGIDIRKGLQMECIACGLCVDACDNVMEKIGLPKGLIRYDTESGIKNQESRKHFLRPRTFWYAAIIGIVGGLMLYGLLSRAPLEVNVVHDRNPLFVTLSGGEIRNGYRVHILNKTHEDRRYRLEVEGVEDAVMEVQGSQMLNAGDLSVFADSVGEFRVFLKASPQKKKRREITFHAVDKESGARDDQDSIFVSAAP